MKVKVVEATISVRRITRAADKKVFEFREQPALVDFPNGERRKIALSLADDQLAYHPGEYLVMDASFEVDRNGRLALGRTLALQPVAASVADKRQAG